MIKLIACDMDGTLLNDEKEISDKNLEALMHWQEKGVKVALASGRNVHRLDKYATKLKLAQNKGLLLEANGASVVDYADNTQHVIARMNHDDCLEVIDLLSSYEEEIIIMGTKNAFIMPKPNETESSWINTMGEESNYGRDLIIINDLSEVNEEVNKICIFSLDEEKIEFINKDLKTRDDKYWHGIIHTTWLEVMPKHLNKGNALKYVMEKYGYQPNEIICFGDSDNDVSMMEEVKYSVAMGNAFDRVKSICYSITKDNTEDGIAYYLDNFKEE